MATGILGTLCLVAGIVSACAAAAATQPAAPAGCAVTPLPPPDVSSDVPLEEALAQRRSVRIFGDRPLSDTELGQLLWAAQGITSERGFRTAPSAGARYPLEVYAITPEGVYHYEPEAHQLVATAPGDRQPALYEAALEQDAVGTAPVVVVIAAVYERMERKYGAERTPRYVHLEAGHAAQNLLLQATALGLDAVPIGAFHDDEVQAALDLPADHAPLYLIPVGAPFDGSR
jgi:SagB-type dehydrogenase family enzyme